jgi:hypothetical protein
MVRRIKVRFNLSRGKNFMKWKCVFPDGTIEYLSPDEVTLIMSRCKLSNNAKQAEKIFQGENKTVCAWILCEEMIITGVPQETPVESSRLRYNPRVKPCWDYKDANADGKEFGCIESRGNRLYVNS